MLGINFYRQRAMGALPSSPPDDLCGCSPLEQAWIALSDLFVDTEITDQDLQFIARRLRAAGFDATSAQRVLLDDVAPVFGWNLHSVAGNWTGWKSGDVVRSVQAWTRRRDAGDVRGMLYRTSWASRLRKTYFAGRVMKDWERTARLLPPFQVG